MFGVELWFVEVLMGILIVAYLFFMSEPYHLINKAEVALVAGTVTFFAIGVYTHFFGYKENDLESFVYEALSSILSLVFFLWVSMIFVEFLVERQVFDVLRDWVFSKNLSYRRVYWLVGFFGFFLSAIVNNLTTALILATVILSVDNKNKDFMIASGISAVVASNAGGAWSAFGDVTSLMTWNAGKVSFVEFLYLLPASFLGWVVTALLLLPWIPKGMPERAHDHTPAKIKKGGFVGLFLGLLSLLFSVLGQAFFHLPSVWGMLVGLSFFLLYGELNKKNPELFEKSHGYAYRFVRNVDFQTLFFFIGILSVVEGLHFMGQLQPVGTLYTYVQPTIVNTLVGFISAIIDNVPVLQVILSVSPEMDKGQWLLLVLTEGIGGSLLILGSAAGIAVMGKMHGVYTFTAHLKKSWAILIGYALSIGIWLIQIKIWPIQ